MLQRDPQNQRLYLHDVVTEKEFTTGGNGHLNTTGPNAANGELFTADILRNALNVKSEQLSAGRSIDEMAEEHLSDEDIAWLKNQFAGGKEYIPLNKEKANAFLQTYGAYSASVGEGIRSTDAIIEDSQPEVKSNNLSARKAAQLATIERSNPFDPELGAHTWIRSAEDILTYREAIDSFGGVDDVTPATQHT